MAVQDSFAHLARYYDPIMAHVNYDRWCSTAIALAELVPDSFRHLDAGCGTGVLVNMLRKVGWSSYGIDLSAEMIRAGRRSRGSLPLAAADLRALPFHHSMDIVTCLFDSANFLLEELDLQQTIVEFSRTLCEGGLLYFDVVTERMVTLHFAGQEWDEENGGFRSTWSSDFDRKTGIAETRVRINTGEEAVIRERIYDRRLIERMLHAAGLTLLAVVDAETWRPPTRHTTRIDFVAMKQPGRKAEAQFRRIGQHVRELLANRGGG